MKLLTAGSKRTIGRGAVDWITVLLVWLAVLFGPTNFASGGSLLPAGFTESLIADGLFSPSAVATMPDGRILICEQAGTVYLIKNNILQGTPFLEIPVNQYSERGLLGIVCDPNFTNNGFVYAYYTAESPAIHNRVSRFLVSGDQAILSSETIILELPDLSSSGDHQGGALHFGPDGKLYIGVGENGIGTNAQSLTTPLGKILRLNKDGSIPTDNPFYSQAQGLGRAAWATGLRNPFSFSFQPGTGRVLINDVGGSLWEEINEGTAGANFGWPIYQGYSEVAPYASPVHAYPHPVNATGAAISGGAFYNPSTPQFPVEYAGKYFFVDYSSSQLSVFDPTTKIATYFGTLGATTPLYLTITEDGSLYYAAHDSGALYRIQYTAELSPQIGTQPQNQWASVGDPAVLVVSVYGAATLSYRWERMSAGASVFSPIPGATTSSYTLSPATLADHGSRFRCVITNSLGTATSDVALLSVTSNKPSRPVIVTPVSSLPPYIAADQTYVAGSTIQFSGTATDPEDGDLSSSAYTWKVDLLHNDQSRPFIAETSGITSGSFFIPVTGETDDNVRYRIYLMTTDSGGLTTTTYREIDPVKSNVTLATAPAGLQLALDGAPTTGPFTFRGVAGVQRTVSAPLQTVNGVVYEFVFWSDGAAATHIFATPASDATLTANFRPVAAPVDGASFVTQDLPAIMVAGQTYYVTTTFQNTGTSIWSGSKYRMGSQNTRDNVTWGTNRVNLSNPVVPGSSVTCRFKITAPGTAGTYNFQWQMLQEGVRWFGDLSRNTEVVVTPPPNAAAYVSTVAPRNMNAGSRYNVSVTMKNVGANTWSAAANYRLGSGPITWGVARVALPSSVAPGQSVTFNFPVTAPATPGSYLFQWAMLQEGVQWFGEPSASETIAVAVPANNASFVFQVPPPTTMAPGQVANVSVTMKNIGSNTWTSGAGFRLGSINPEDNFNWGSARIALPASVLPGREVTFNFAVAAPSAAGNYNFQWLMLQEGVQWFGAPSATVGVTVSGPPPNSATFVSQTPLPASMIAGQYASVTLTFKNTGSNAWTSGSLYRLGSASPQDNSNWHFPRVSLPASVPPGGMAAFTFQAIAPPTPGAYSFQWRMVQDGVGWFGDFSTKASIAVTAPPANAATFVSQTPPPAAMKSGEIATVKVTMKNIGTAPWTAGANYRLGSLNPPSNSNWGQARVYLTTSVAPGAQVTFSFPAKAPSVAGNFGFQWAMVQDGVQWFGDVSPNVTVNVTVPPPLPPGRMEVLEVAGSTLQGNPWGDRTARRVALFIPQQVQLGQAVRIVYFLPGYYGSSEDYIAQGSNSPFSTLVQSMADEGKPLIIAVADGRNRFGGSQYLNSTAQGNYDTYIAEEIVAAVEARYPAANGRAGRIVAGWSSGGYGALMFGMSRQSLFSAVVALSPDSEFEVEYRPFVEGAEMRAVTPTMVAAWTNPTYPAVFPSSQVAIALGLSAAYAPVGPGQPGRFRWLYDEAGQFQTDVWQKWLEKDPLLIVRANLNAFASDQRVYLDGTANDEWRANIGARHIFDILRNRPAPVTFNEPPGYHGDNLPGRLADGLRWVLR